MPPRKVQVPLLPTEPRILRAPLLPTIVVSCFKGGVYKTTIALGMAERLAWAGLRVLLLTCDPQEDARHRMRKGATGQIIRESYGPGSVTLVSAKGSISIEIVFRKGPDRLGMGAFDIAIMDTPPMEEGGSLPGVFLVVPIDWEDAVRNAITMLQKTPPNTQITLVRVSDDDRDLWDEDVRTIFEVMEREVGFLETPLPADDAVKWAHKEGRSVWTLERRGKTRVFLSALEALTRLAWEHYFPGRSWSMMPVLAEQSLFFEGWDSKYDKKSR